MTEESWNSFEPKELFSIVHRLYLCEAIYDADGWLDGYSETVKRVDRTFFIKEYTYGLRMMGGSVTLYVDYNTPDDAGDEYLVVRLDSKGGVTLKSEEDISEFFWPDPYSEMVREEAFRKWYRSF